MTQVPASGTPPPPAIVTSAAKLPTDVAVKLVRLDPLSPRYGMIELRASEIP